MLKAEMLTGNEVYVNDADEKDAAFEAKQNKIT